MTGYGRGESFHGGVKFTVELNSVNRKQSDVVINIDRDLIQLEPRIRDEINSSVTRGRLNVVVAWQNESKNKPEAQIDFDVAKGYIKSLKKLQKELKLPLDISIEGILRCPGVLKAPETRIDPEVFWPHIEAALKKALDQLVKMREKEGKHLKADLLKRLTDLSLQAASIRKEVPNMVERYRTQLHERVKKAGLDISFEDERLLKEVVLFADRADITEELTRLESHFVQFKDSLNSSNAVGRTLEFLTQEINREINTIGSKANLLEISQTVVNMKSEIERIREQIQNVE